MGHVRRLSVAFVVVALSAVTAVACRPIHHPGVPVAGADCAFSQWGGSASHDGQVCGIGQKPGRELAHATIDPFVVQEQAEGRGGLLAHYQVPLLDDRGDVFVLQKSGTYVPCSPPGSGQPAPCGFSAWPRQTWAERAMTWTPKGLVDRWTFQSDWKPLPVASGWEPMFQPALARGFIYIPGSGGTVYQVDGRTGRVFRHINPLGASVDPNAYVSGGLAADAWGNIYYNVLTVDPNAPWTADAQGWLVRISPAGRTSLVDYKTLVPDAPRATDSCYLTFTTATPSPAQPWPPAPQSDGSPTLPPQTACLSQRPAVNVTPAVGRDGTIFTVSRSHAASAYSYVVALRPNLTVKWASSLRGRLNDGCGVTVPFGSDPSDCRVGSTPTVDPRTNLPPAATATDNSSASPVALPDGGVLYGAYTVYNSARGHLMKFDAAGRFAGAFDFGWDITPAIYRHGWSYSIVIKDNHYGETGPFYITQLDANLKVQWQYRASNTQTCKRLPDGTVSCTNDGEHPNGFEWCINAPAIDANGNVYVTSEDGNLYVIGQGGVERSRFFLSQTTLAAYTPLALDRAGRIYAMNNGQLSVLGH
jgi:outer membrane protein assembly factor BamB